MKKFFSLVLALVMALSLTTVAWAEEVVLEGEGTQAAPYLVDAADELKAAFDEGGYVKLTGDITLTNTKTLTFTDEWTVVPVGKTVTLDLAGYDITRNVDDTLGAIRVLGELIINDSVGGGVISDKNYAVAVGYKDVAGAGAKLTVNAGTLTAGSFAITGNGSYAGTTITSQNTTIIINGGAITSTAGAGIYHPQAGTLTINGGTVTGYDSGIAIKSGTLTVNGGTVRCTGPDSTPTTGYSDGVNASGAAIQIESSADYAGGVVVNVKGGTVTSDNGAAVYEYNAGTNSVTPTTDTAVNSVSVSGGDVTGKIMISEELAAEDAVEVSGGSFSVAPPEEYLADGFVPVLVNGVYVPQKAADNSVNKGSNGIDTEDWKVVDLTTGTAYDIAEDAEVEKIVYKDIKNTVNGKTTIRYGVTLYGPLTFEDAGAAANGGYAMVVAKDSANIQLETDAGKIIFARFLTAAEYAEYAAMDAQYAYTTLVATKFVEAADAPYDCEDPYMDYYVVGDDYYAAASSNADNTLVRYKNEFVLVGAKLDAEPLVPHAFMIAPGDCKWSIKDNELSSVKCTCDDTFKVVQDIKGLKAGSYYALGDGNYVVLKATSSGKLPSGTTVVPSTDKVQSADTFDAGIAMYVGMSIMAAAGAVVLKKRED